MEDASPGWLERLEERRRPAWKLGLLRPSAGPAAWPYFPEDGEGRGPLLGAESTEEERKGVRWDG